MNTLQKKIDKLISDHAYEVYATKDLPSAEQDKEQLRLHRIYKSALNQLFEELLDRVDDEVVGYGCEYCDYMGYTERGGMAMEDDLVEKEPCPECSDRIATQRKSLQNIREELV